MTTWPPAIIPVFPDGWDPVTSDFTTWIQDNFSFVTAGIVFRAHQTAAQALTGGAFTTLQFGSVDEDPYGGWSATLTASQPANSWLAPVTGLYEVTLTLGAVSSTNWLETQVSLSGTAYTLGEQGCAGSGGDGCGGTAYVPMTAGVDWVQLQGFVSTGVNTLTGAGLATSAEITLVSQ